MNGEIIFPLLGGVLIGLAASLVLITLGKITGISGIITHAIFNPTKPENSWRILFVFGLLFGGFVMRVFYPELFNYSISENIPLLIFAGLLVGFGTRLGSGCTSGHGVCGLPRLSIRSLVATLTFMISGIITVAIKGAL
jgi:hypothetical protein